MRNTIFLSFCLLFAFLWGLPPVSGEDGRDFAGSYELSNVTDMGEEVSITFSVRIFNYSGADLMSGTVVLADPLFLGEYGYFSEVWIEYRKYVRLKGDFTIPTREYEQWQQGATPYLFVEFVDGAGNLVQRAVELIEMPLGEEES